MPLSYEDILRYTVPSFADLTIERKYQRIREQLHEMESLVHSQLYFLTINFKPDVSLEQVLGCLSKLSHRTFMTRYWYSVEQRGDDDESLGTGIHSHWLVNTKHPIGQFRRDCFNTCKNYVGNIMHVDVRHYPQTMFSDKLDYLRGVKWDPEKDLKVRYDRLFRHKNFLADIYTNVQAEVPRPASSPI